MMRALSVFALLLLATPALAETRIVQTPAVPADAAPNNPAVPDASMARLISAGPTTATFDVAPSFMIA